MTAMRMILILIAFVVIGSVCMAQANLTFAWDLSTDDAQLGTGGGYHLYASKQSGNYGTTAYATVAPGVNTVTQARPGVGKWYFVADAFLADGTKSEYSNEVSITIKPNPPRLNSVLQAVVDGITNAIDYLAGLFKSNKGNGNLKVTS